MKDHPDSPVKYSEIQTDATQRHFVVRDGKRFRVKTRMVEVKPRTFQRWTDTVGEPIAEVVPVIGQSYYIAAPADLRKGKLYVGSTAILEYLIGDGDCFVRKPGAALPFRVAVDRLRNY